MNDSDGSGSCHTVKQTLKNEPDDPVPLRSSFAVREVNLPAFS